MRKRYSRSYTVLSFLTMFSYREQPSGSRFFASYTGCAALQKRTILVGLTSARQNAPILRKFLANSELPKRDDRGVGTYAKASILPISRRGGRLCPPAGCTGFPGNPRRIRSCPPGGAQPCPLPAAFASRVYLKTHDVTGSEGFLRCARHFFAGILTYFKEK